MAVVQTNVSWFSRIKDSFKGIVAGILLIVAGVVMLYWNEGRTVAQRIALNEGQSQVINVTTLSADNEGKLIHTTNQLVSDEDLVYPDLAITETTGLKFAVDHEVFQWKENADTKTEEKVGGGQTQTTTYSYEKEWSSSEIDSSSFEGPEKNQYSNMYTELSQLGLRGSATVTVAKVGEFTLSSKLFDQATQYESYEPTDAMLTGVTALVAQTFGSGFTVSKKGEYIYLQQLTGTDSIDDIRIKFSIMKEQPTSVIGKQEGSMINPFYTSNNTDISMISMGSLSAEQMFQEAHAANEMTKWIVRIVGFFMIFFGFSSLLRPLVVLASVIPFLGSIVGAGTGLISFLLALTVWLVTVAIAWIRFRPVVAIVLLIAAAGTLVGMWYVGKNKKTSVPSETKKPEETASEVIEA